MAFSDAVRFRPPVCRAIFRAEGGREFRRFAQAQDHIRLIGQFVGIVEIPLPKFAAVVDHARFVAELRMQRTLDHGQQLFAVPAHQRVVAGPIAVISQQVHEFAHLVELLHVGRVETAADHRRALLVDHFLEKVLDRFASQLEMAGVQRAERGGRAIADPLAPVLEDARIHRAVVGNHSMQPESCLVENLLHGPVFGIDGGNADPIIAKGRFCFGCILVGERFRQFRERFRFVGQNPGNQIGFDGYRPVLTYGEGADFHTAFFFVDSQRQRTGNRQP